MKIKQYIEKLRQKFEIFVENRTDKNKKSIIVFCVIILLVMAVMNMCKAIKPMFKNKVETQQQTEIISEE